MKENEERAYSRGARQAWLTIMKEAMRNLGQDSKEWNDNRWRIEREETISTLRDLCGQFGDNDWPDNLHLSDVIEKHLVRPLNDAARK